MFVDYSFSRLHVHVYATCVLVALATNPYWKSGTVTMRGEEWNQKFQKINILISQNPNSAATAYYSRERNSVPKFRNYFFTECHGTLLNFASPYRGSAILSDDMRALR